MCRERGERPSEAYQPALPRHSRDNGKPEFSVLPYDWIPACAGMTKNYREESRQVQLEKERESFRNYLILLTFFWGGGGGGGGGGGVNKPPNRADKRGVGVLVVMVVVLIDGVFLKDCSSQVFGCLAEEGFHHQAGNASDLRHRASR